MKHGSIALIDNEMPTVIIAPSDSLYEKIISNVQQVKSRVGSATYTYKVGMDINISGTTVFTALLVEALARRYGANSYEAQGHYPINVTRPIGTRLEIFGMQQINSVTASVGSRSVSGIQYGDVTITVVTSNRSHAGSSN